MKETSLVILSVSLTLLMPAGSALGQALAPAAAPASPSFTPYPPATYQPVNPAPPNFIDAPSGAMIYGAQNQNSWLRSGAQVPAQSEIAKLVKELGEVDDSAKKAELTKQLEGEVAKSFDQDMQQREGDLTSLEERVKKLRSQLDRRRKAKDDIIQLQIKVLVNEAEGLGFSRQSVQSNSLPKAATRSVPAPATAQPVSPPQPPVR